MSQLKDYLIHYRKKIEKGVDDEKKLYIIRKLRNVKINKDILLETGIGKTVKQLGKERGEVGEESSALLKLWKDFIYKSSVSTSKTFVNGKGSGKGTKRTPSVLSDGQNIDIPYEPAPKKPKYDADYLEQQHYISDPYPKHSAESKTNSVNRNGYSLYEEPQQNTDPDQYVPTNHSLPIKHEAYDPAKPEIVVSRFKEYNPTPIPVIKSLSDSNGCSPAEEEEEGEEEETPSSRKPSDKEIEEAKMRFAKELEKQLKSEMKQYENVLSKVSNSNSPKSSYPSKKHKTTHEEKQKVKSPVTEPTKKHKSHYKSDVNHQKKHTAKTECTDRGEKLKAPTNSSEKGPAKSIPAVKPTKKKIKVPEAEVFTASEATFEDCLGLNDIVSYKKKKPSKPAKTKQAAVEKTSPSKEKSNKEKSGKVVSPDKTKSRLSSDESKSKPSSMDKVRLSADKVKTKSSPDKVTSSTDKVKSKSSTDKVKSKSSADKSRSKASEHSSKNDKEKLEKLPKELRMKPKPLKIDEDEFHITLPEISANYRPLPRIDYDSPLYSKKSLSNDDAIKYTSSKKDRTAVYSGRKNIGEVQPLYQRCCDVLFEHVALIEYVGHPYEVLKPILERCTPDSLLRLEDFNPYLLDDTHVLWQQHCVRDFRNQKPDEGETWRDMYIRIVDERKKRLQKITSDIKGSISNSNQARRAKLAYIDSYVKPPRDIARRQAKFGTAQAVNHTTKPSPPVPPKATIKSASPVAFEKPSSSAVSSVPKKPFKPAPLMAKTLKAMKQVYRR